MILVAYHVHYSRVDTFPDHGVRVLYVLSTSQVLLVFPVTIVVFPLQQLCIRVFSTIINILLYEWADTHNKINKAQAGFRRGYSAIDKKKCLQSVVQKYLSRTSGRFYFIYV